MSENFPPEAVTSIVAHMNEDHADAVLAIAQVHGGAREATLARMVALAPGQLDIDIEEAGATRRVSVPVDPPIEPIATVRARLVEMTKSARAALGGSSAGR